VAVITSPNPALSSERSRSYTGGIIWEPIPRGSISIDYWKIKRTNEINQEQVDSAILAGSVVRDATNVSNVPGDPGADHRGAVALREFGLDPGARHRRRCALQPPPAGRLGQCERRRQVHPPVRMDPDRADGTSRDFAGTHGNCDISNCAGTPDNRVNMRFGYDRNDWRVSLNANFRGAIENKLFRGDTECANRFANGADAPRDCELASFISWDLVARWKPFPQWEVFGSIQNLFDKVAPLDPLTYGAQAYNPVDYEGARGRSFSVGARYTFQ
jgi:iron complex outermembrane receptor protein